MASSSSKMDPEVFVRIFVLKGLSADALKNFPKGRVSISSELSNTIASTSFSAIGGAGKINEVVWGVNDGMIKWSISSEEMTHLKAVQPKLKLNVMLQAEGGGEPQNYGYVLLDMRDLAREISPQSFKIHGMNGAELQISAKLNTVLHAKLFPTSISSSEPKLLGSSPTADNAISVAASTDSVRSVLRLALAGQSESENTGAGTKVRFSLGISLEEYHDLSSLCKQAIENDKLAAANLTYPLPTRTFWLCWTLFDKLFQSEEFCYGEPGPTRVRDTIRVECPLQSLPEHITKASPLRIYLCSQDLLLASADIPLPVVTADVAERDDVSIHQAGWGYFSTPVGSATSYSNKKPDKPAVKIGVQFTIESIIPPPGASDEEYENDAFDTDTAAGGNEEKSGKAVHFQVDSPATDAREELPVPPPLEIHEEGQEPPYDEIADEQLRHFRISLEVRSVCGLKRPAHIALSFSYPYLGSSSPIRTHPIWILANTESRIDGAAASYECCMTRESLRETLKMHPLRIQAHARSQMGSTAAGDIDVDLSATHRATPHSFRCPVTQRIFKTRNEYSKHRQTMLALRSAGRIPTAPPAEPVVVRVTDSYYVFAHSSGSGASDGSKARVVVIVEDIGVVGPEMSVGVQLGYKMHGAGVYVSEDQDSAALGDRSVSDSTTEAKDPSLRQDLSSEESARLEMLKLEWESWRRQAEAAWREALREKEAQMKKRLESESAAALANRADDLRRAHEEAGRLEVRLRSAIDAADRQKSQLTIKEEQMAMRLAQKTSELQLLQKRVRDEAKIRIDIETRRADSLQQQLDSVQGVLERTEKRARDTEKEYEVRTALRNPITETTYANLIPYFIHTSIALPTSSSCHARERVEGGSSSTEGAPCGISRRS